MEKIIGLKEFREKLPDYERQVAEGISFIVVKKSRPVFRISPVDQQSEDLWEEVIDFTKLHKGGVAIEDLLSRL
jgi:prevent-host-death family protein